MSVGFLHTPNFAAFWPKPRKKRILGQCAGIMQTVLHLTPPLQMSGSCPKPKKTSRNRKILGQCAGITQTVLHLTPPCRCQAPVPKPKKHREIERFCPKPKKASRNRKNQKTQRFWDNVLVSCKHSVGQIGFCFFFDFSRFSVLDKIFRFLDVFFDFGWFLSNSQCFFSFWTPSFDFSMFLGCLQQKLQHRTA